MISRGGAGISLIAEILPSGRAGGFAGVAALGAGLAATLAATGFATGFVAVFATGTGFLVDAAFFAGADFRAVTTGLRAGVFAALAGLRAALAGRFAAAGFRAGFFGDFCLLRAGFFAGFFFAAIVTAPGLLDTREK